MREHDTAMALGRARLLSALVLSALGLLAAQNVACLEDDGGPGGERSAVASAPTGDGTEQAAAEAVEPDAGVAPSAPDGPAALQACLCNTEDSSPECEYAYYAANLICQPEGTDDTTDQVVERDGSRITVAAYADNDLDVICQIPSLFYQAFSADQIRQVMVYHRQPDIAAEGGRPFKCSLYSRGTSDLADIQNALVLNWNEDPYIQVLELIPGSSLPAIQFGDPLVWLHCEVSYLPEYSNEDFNTIESIRVCYIP
jgi:hypothetical protein